MIYGTTNRCTGGVASASSFLDDNAAYNADKAFDGDVATAWISKTPLPAYIIYDCGAGVYWKISKVTIRAVNTANYIYAPKTFTMQGSINGTDFTVLDTQTDLAAWTQNELKTFTFTNKNIYRYIKINVTATESTTYAAIGEMQMFEGIYSNAVLLNLI